MHVALRYTHAVCQARHETVEELTSGNESLTKENGAWVAFRGWIDNGWNFKTLSNIESRKLQGAGRDWRGVRVRSHAARHRRAGARVRLTRVVEVGAELSIRARTLHPPGFKNYCEAELRCTYR